MIDCHQNVSDHTPTGKQADGVKPSIRTLVVEDEAEIRLASVLRLRSMGYAVDAADDGLACLEKIDQKDYDVVLMDIRMPRLDGIETLKRLRQDDRTRRIPVVMVSASLGDQGHALDSGAEYFIRKPFAPERIREAIERVCGPASETAT